MNYTLEQIEKTIKAKGYKWFENGDFNLNMIGVRNSSTGDVVTNLFDDTMTLSYKENGTWKFHQWAATTEPGKKGMLEGKAVGGVAFVVPNQYPGAYRIGMHFNYEALSQKGDISVYRDDNYNMKFDKKKITTGNWYGINIHKAGADSTWVENWSEGCQVFKRDRDFNQFMDICRTSRKIYGNSFTYTLLESSDIEKANAPAVPTAPAPVKAITDKTKSQEQKETTKKK